MWAYNFRPCFFAAFQCTVNHLMWNSICKKNEEVWTSNHILHIPRHLCENLYFTVIFFTDFFVRTNHSIMASNNYNTHIKSMKLRLSFIKIFGMQILRVCAFLLSEKEKELNVWKELVFQWLIKIAAIISSSFFKNFRMFFFLISIEEPHLVNIHYSYMYSIY